MLGGQGLMLIHAIYVVYNSKWAFGQLKLDDTSVIYVLGSHGICVIFRYPIYSCYY